MSESRLLAEPKHRPRTACTRLGADASHGRVCRARVGSIFKLASVRLRAGPLSSRPSGANAPNLTTDH
jgi:hypothetical protein